MTSADAVMRIRKHPARNAALRKQNGCSAGIFDYFMNNQSAHARLSEVAGPRSADESSMQEFYQPGVLTVRKSHQITPNQTL
jgi:hypothetical protein